MSEVISFRLNLGNTREALAAEVIHSWQLKGFSIRQIMVEALLKLDLEGNPSYTEQFLQISKKMADLIVLLRSQNINEGLVGNDEQDRDTDQELSGKFIAAMKMIAKPGLCSR